MPRPGWLATDEVLGMYDSAFGGEYHRFDDQTVHKLKQKHRLDLQRRNVGFVFH